MHACPDCGQACYCGGDFDDIEVSRRSLDCVHRCDPEDTDDDIGDLDEIVKESV
jgi:hypothetical protein